MFIFLGLACLIYGGEFCLMNLINTLLEKDWNLSSTQIQLAGSMYFIGNFLGYFVSSFISNSYGRKICLLAGLLL